MNDYCKELYEIEWKYKEEIEEFSKSHNIVFPFNEEMMTLFKMKYF